MIKLPTAMGMECFTTLGGDALSGPRGFAVNQPVNFGRFTYEDVGRY